MGLNHEVMSGGEAIRELSDGKASIFGHIGERQTVESDLPNHTCGRAEDLAHG